MSVYQSKFVQDILKILHFWYQGPLFQGLFNCISGCSACFLSHKIFFFNFPDMLGLLLPSLFRIHSFLPPHHYKRELVLHSEHLHLQITERKVNPVLRLNKRQSLRLRIVLQYKDTAMGGGRESERNIVYSWFIRFLWGAFLHLGTLHAKLCFSSFYYLQLALYIKVLADVWLMVSIYHTLRSRWDCSQLRAHCVMCFWETLHLFMQIHEKSAPFNSFLQEGYFDNVSVMRHYGKWQMVAAMVHLCCALEYGCDVILDPDYHQCKGNVLRLSN